MRWPRSRRLHTSVPVLSKSYTAVDGYVASLNGGKISWGAFNTLRKDEIAVILSEGASQ